MSEAVENEMVVDPVECLETLVNEKMAFLLEADQKEEAYKIKMMFDYLVRCVQISQVTTHVINGIGILNNIKLQS